MRNKIEIVVFIMVIAFFGIGYIVYPQREFSEMENRYLTTRPEFSWKDLLNGDYTAKFDTYTADQILGKDLLVETNVAANYAVGISRVNQVYIGKDQYLIQDYQKPGDQLNANLNYIRGFAAEHPEVDMRLLIVPNVNEIYPEKLPRFAETYSQATVISQIQSTLEPDVTVIDASAILKEHKEEGIYYKTDHHWNSLGAYYGYTELCRKLGIETKGLDQYEPFTVEEPFFGSLYSKVPLFSQEPDEMTIYQDPQGSYQVTYVSENRTTDTMIDMDYATRKDKYAMYFGGNYPLVHIESNSGNQQKVLVIKDSYANDLVPFLTADYSDIYMMDLRYYHEDVGKFMEQEGITQVLFIHNVDFISTDNNFLWL